MNSSKHEAVNIFSFITIFIGATASVISSFAFHAIANHANPTDGFPWAIKPITWQEILILILPFVALVLSVMISRRNFSSFLGLVTSILCTALAFGQFALHDPQHGAEGFITIWLIEMVICVMCLGINSAVALVTLALDYLE